MNIFFLDKHPATAAHWHCDQHVGKMVLESAQMLCTVHSHFNELKGYLPDWPIYKPTHKNHPCTKWLFESVENYRWLYYLMGYLNTEFSWRRGKDHLSYTKLARYLILPPDGLPCVGMTLPALAMPDEFKPKEPYTSFDQACESYKKYYLSKKNSFKRGVPTWEHCPKPDWWED